MRSNSATARSRAKRLLGVLAVTAVVAVGCSNSGSDDTAETTATTAAPSETTAAPTDTTEASGGLDIGSFESISGVPGVTDEAITYAVLGTGAANPMGYCLLDCFAGGVQAYFDYRNANGGIHGRQLQTTKVDDELGLNQVKALELKDSQDVFGVFDAPVMNMGMADLAASGMPIYTVYPSAGDAIGLENVYIPSGTNCSLCDSPITTQETLLLGGHKVASLGLGVAQSSKDCVDRTEKEIGIYGPPNGIEFVYKNSDLPFGFTNGVAPEVTAMKDLGVDTIVTCVDQNSVLVLEQELERQGMSDVGVVLPQGYGDTDYLQNNATVLEGSLLATAYMPFEADGEGTDLATMKEWLGKSGVMVNDYAIEGWLGAELAVEGLLAAGPQFDRAKVVEATNGLTAWTANGVVPPVDWSTAHTPRTNDGPGALCQAFLVIKGGTTELLGDPAKPFFCFTMPMAEWVEPVPTA